MNDHLTSEQIADLLAGVKDVAHEPHLRVCPQCFDEFTGLQTTLSVFRDSVHDWSRHPVPDAFLVSRPKPWRLGWSVPAVAAVLVLALLPAYLDVREAQDDVNRINDSNLLRQVNVQLGRTVPASMEPLMELMRFDETEQIGVQQ